MDGCVALRCIHSLSKGIQCAISLMACHTEFLSIQCDCFLLVVCYLSQFVLKLDCLFTCLVTLALNLPGRTWTAWFCCTENLRQYCFNINHDCIWNSKSRKLYVIKVIAGELKAFLFMFGCLGYCCFSVALSKVVWYLMVKFHMLHLVFVILILMKEHLLL